MARNVKGNRMKIIVASKLKDEPLEDLKKARTHLDKIIKAKQAGMKRARTRIVSLAKRAGVKLADLGIKAGRGPDKKPRKIARARRRTPGPLELHVRKTGARYIGPNGKTWGGIGRPPLWFKAMRKIANGATAH